MHVLLCIHLFPQQSEDGCPNMSWYDSFSADSLPQFLNLRPMSISPGGWSLN